ncbi:MAG: hypothetical protein WAK60_08030 [Sedimentisphaerales bacterium]
MEINKPLFIVMLLLAATAASGAPTVAADNIIVPTVQTASDTPAVIAPTEEVVGPIDAKLANLGREFLQPPASFVVLGNAQGNYVKPLPAVPAAVFMVLSGFLCISLVRDRRVWLAALAGLLWAGQIGVQALPQLALRLSHRNYSQQQLSAELTYPYYLENSNRLRSDIEGTQYIGLLHHLAGIPAAKSCYFHKDTHHISLSQPAIAPARRGLCLFFTCLASRTEQFVLFSPAFIFANLPRGPPILT